jgi:hypothetical protein
MITKMLVPMMVPIPSAVRSSTPTARLRVCPSTCVSASSVSVDCVAQMPRSERGRQVRSSVLFPSP